MKYKNAPKLLAEEAWRMITDECKEKMTSLKDNYIESLTEDIEHFSNANALEFGKWILRHFNDYGRKTEEELLEIFKK